ncbi:MAG: HHL1-like protein [Cyanobacteria bacterium P01_G01_bin.38]
MATGFGKPQEKPKVSDGAKQRQKAAKRMDSMREDGTPEYEIYIRVEGKKQWYPVGVIAVKRSSQINQAIFGSQDDLLQGAFRIYPVLRKNQQHLEYGYRLKGKEFREDPIELAVKPTVPGAGLFGQLKNRVTSAFKKDA